MASEYALIGSSAEAGGHPSDCTETVSGTVQSTSSTSVSVNGTEVASTATADIHFDTHSHEYSGDPPSCKDDQSHDIDPDDPGPGLSDSVTINGNPVYLKADAVTTDPGSGGDVNITGNGGNSSLTET